MPQDALKKKLFFKSLMGEESGDALGGIKKAKINFLKV